MTFTTYYLLVAASSFCVSLLLVGGSGRPPLSSVFAALCIAVVWPVMLVALLIAALAAGMEGRLDRE